MAGGAAINVFKFNTGALPKETLNVKLWFAVFGFGLMGAARGVDEGLITGVFNSHAFKQSVGIDTSTKMSSLVSRVPFHPWFSSVVSPVLCLLFSFVIVSAVFGLPAGSAVSGSSASPSLLETTATWTPSTLVASLLVLVLGRLVSSVPSTFRKFPPAAIRGLCTCMFTGAVYLGILLAYFANWGAELHMADTFNRWAVPTSLHLMFAGIILILSFFQLESPRFYIKQGKREKALEILCKLRGLPADHPYILDEITEMDVAFQEEMEATRGMGWKGLFKEILGI